VFHFPNQIMSARTVDPARDGREQDNTRSFFDEVPDRWHSLQPGAQSPRTSRIA